MDSDGGNKKQRGDLLDSERAHDGRSKVDRYQWANPKEKGALKWVDKVSLSVDHKYQRDALEHKVRTIAADFNWPAFGVLIIARRGDRLFVVDGQHRWLAVMTRADVKEVPCILFDSGGIASEAKTFLDAQLLRKAVSAVDKFRALLVIKDPTAMAVQGMLEDAGRTVSRTSGSNTVACVTKMMALHVQDPHTMTTIWPVITRLCRDTIVHERLLDAIFYLERHLPDDVSLTQKKWADRLVNLGPERCIRQIASAAAFYARGGARTYADGLLQLLNKGLREGNKLELRAKESREE